MKIFFFCLVYIFLGFKTGNAQCLSLKRDTITYITLRVFEDKTDNLLFSYSVFDSEAKLYDAYNFPFIFQNCGSNEEYENNEMYYTNYSSIVNKNVAKLLIELEKKTYKKASTWNVADKKEISDLISCLEGQKLGELFYAEQKAVVDYFILKCDAIRGAGGDPILCKEVVDYNEVPVILNVDKVL